MIAIPVFLLWTAYAMGMWGFSLLKGWNISLKQIISPVNYYGSQPNQPWPPDLAGNTVIIPDGTSKSSVTATLTAAGSTTSTTTSTGTTTTPTAKSVKNSKVINLAAKKHGWNKGTQWAALTNIIHAESGGNPMATNPNSGAFGIAQALGHGTANTTGCGRNEYGGFGLTDKQAQEANCGNAAWQMVWMLNYIKARYGTPEAAWAYHQKNNSY